MENLIDLKKSLIIKKNYYQKGNFLELYTSSLLINILKLIKVKFQKALIIGDNFECDKYLIDKNIKFKKIKSIDIFNEDSSYDLIISNCSLQLELYLDKKKIIPYLNNLLNKDGLIIMSFLNELSFITLKKTFIEIDNSHFNGAYERLGPFLNTQEIINFLQNNKFGEIVASNDRYEVNYQSLKSLRNDFKSIGTSNFFLPRPAYSRQVFKSILNIFNNLKEKNLYMPVEYEITVISAWK